MIGISGSTSGLSPSCASSSSSSCHEGFEQAHVRHSAEGEYRAAARFGEAVDTISAPFRVGQVPNLTAVEVDDLDVPTPFAAV